jgi:hypothetical protein
MKKISEDIEAEMDFMGKCARLNQSLLPYREFVLELDKLAKEWLKTHKTLPKWW